MRRLQAALLFLTLSASQAALADALTVEGVAETPLAAIVQSGTLVRSERDIEQCGDGGACIARSSNLHVGYVIENMGTGTDFSPSLMIWLTMFNDIREAKTVSAQWRIGAAYQFYDARRIEAGIYHFDLLDYAARGDVPCRKRRITLQVDARAASVAVRQGKGKRHYDHVTYSGPVAVGEVASVCLND